MKRNGARIVLVTGSSSGFGAACTREFAAAGDTVVATARDPQRIPAGATGHIERRALDVTDPESIRACVASVLANHGRIDVLVNNAGIHLLGAIEEMDDAAFRRVMETNLFGPIALARSVLPSMRQRRHGHLISVSSIGARLGRVIDGAYCASKAALENAMEALRHEVARFGIRVCVVAPGAYRTGISRRFERAPVAGPAAGPESPYRRLQAFRFGKLLEAVADGGDPSEVAAVIRAVADEPAPGFRYVVGARALEMDRTLNALDDAGRQALIERLAGIGWWTSGADAPPPDAPEDAS